MIATFKRWITPPVYPDADDDRIARLLALILAVVFSLNTLILLSALLVPPQRNEFIFTALLLSVAFIVGLFALKRGAPPRPIARALLVIFWLTTFVISMSSGAVDAMNLSAQVVIIVVAALLLTGRDVIFFTVASLVAGFALAAMQQWAGLLSMRIPDTPLLTWVFQSGVLIFTGILLYWTFRQFTTLLQQARAHEQDLSQRNTALEREIAERKAAQQRETRLVSILEATSDLVGMADLEGNAIYLNTASRAKFGLSDSDEIRKRHLSTFHPAWAAKIVLEEGVPTAVRDGIWVAETAILTDKGEERPVSQMIIAHRDEKGAVTYLSTVIRDLSERKQHENALRASEQRLKLAMQVARMGTWDWNLVTDEDNWDESTHQLFDVPLGAFERTVDAFAARVDQADQDALSQMIAQCRETGAPFDLEYRVRHRDGQIRWLHSLGHTYFDDSGKPLQMIGIVQDITARKDAETAVRASEHRLKLAMQVAGMGMWDWDIETDIEIWDEMTHRLFGVSVGAFNTTMDVFNALVDPDDQQAVEAMTQTCRETGATFDIQYRVLRPDGQRRWMHSLGQIYYDAEGKAQHMLGVVQDITERKQAEQQQMELALERERVELLKNILHTMSHDLKTPLTAINTSLYLLERATTDTQRQPRIDSIKEQVTYLDHLIQDILTLARLEHTPHMKVERVDINHACQLAANQLRAAAERKHIDVQLDLDNALQPISADRSEIQRVIVNLIENALNYTAENGSVRVRSYRTDDVVALEIEDTGIGISSDDLPHIFERFYRADDARATVEGGTGLGLAIVKQIIEMHDGSISVESQRGRGTTFCIKLPLHDTLPVPN
jgi:PAS domain S-box-containing protein